MFFLARRRKNSFRLLGMLLWLWVAYANIQAHRQAARQPGAGAYPARSVAMTPQQRHQWEREQQAQDEADEAVWVFKQRTQKHQFEGAVAAGETVVRLYPNNPSFHLMLSYDYGMLHRPRECLRESDRALKLDPSLLQARENRGEALAELGRVSEAQADWQAVLRAQKSGEVANQARQMLARYPQ